MDTSTDKVKAALTGEKKNTNVQLEKCPSLCEENICVPCSARADKRQADVFVTPTREARHLGIFHGWVLDDFNNCKVFFETSYSRKP